MQKKSAIVAKTQRLSLNNYAIVEKKPLTVERKFAIVAKKSAIIAEFKTCNHHKKNLRLSQNQKSAPDTKKNQRRILQSRVMQSYIYDQDYCDEQFCRF